MFADDQGRDVVVRVGRYGPYLERMIIDDEGEEKSQRANLPDDLPPDELDLALAEELFSTPQEGRSLGTDPESGHEILAKEGRFGPYVTEVLPEGAKEKPRTGSLFAVDDALRDHHRRRAEAAVAAPRRRDRPGVRRGDHRAERALRPVHQEGQGLALARQRGQALHGHPRGGPEDLRAAQAARAGRREAAAEGAGQGPGLRRADGGQGRPVRARTSPTARGTTPRCARATTSRR